MPLKFKFLKKKIKEDDGLPVICKNCETEFIGNYCPNCGQSKNELDKPFKFVAYDFMGTLFAFDSRFFHTLLTILTKPGKLSADFIEGRRARYMPPFRFFIFVSFFFFLFLNYYTKKDLSEKNFLSQELVNDSLLQEVNKDSIVTLSRTENGVNFRLNENFKDDLSEETKELSDSVLTSKIEKFEKFADKLSSEAEQDSSLSKEDKKFIRSIEKVRNYPELYIEKIFKYTSWSLFIMMPFFALLLKLLYRRKKFNYVRHFVFSVNVHSFNFFILTIIMLFQHLGSDFLAKAFRYTYLLVPLFLIVGMKKFYNQGLPKTILKFFILISLYFFVLLLAVASVLALAFYNV